MNIRHILPLRARMVAASIAIVAAVASCGGPDFSGPPSNSSFTDATDQPDVDKSGIWLIDDDATMGADGGADATTDGAIGDSGDATTEGGDAGQSQDGGEAGCGSLTNIHSCGWCGNDCTLLSNISAAGVACNGGHCSYACTRDYADCADAGDGCGTHLASTANCGSCGVSCAGATPVCSRGAGSGAYSCVSGCVGTQSNCDGTCADLASDPTNCGKCGIACNLAHTTSACNASSCVVAACYTGFADCDKLASTGCEVNTTSDTNNCGACGNVCSLPHATATCSASRCAIASCNLGFADCDGIAANGCETDITQPANCGGCNTAALPSACGAATPVCSPSGCVSGCPASTPTLCGGTHCVNTTTDPSNCAGCNSVCVVNNASAGCASSICTVAMCSTGFADCNGQATDGCEINTTNDVNNCGRCGTKCAFVNATPVCSNSNCAIASCTTGFADCNNNPADGCEVNMTNDNNNCGACGRACASGTICSASRCVCNATSCPNGCCVGNTCQSMPQWYPDCDGDGFGAIATGSGTPVPSCSKPTIAPPACTLSTATWTTNVSPKPDCCDVDANARPNQTAFFTTADACGSFDYNCSGDPLEMQYGDCGSFNCNGGTNNCDVMPSGCSCTLSAGQPTSCTGASGSIPSCGQSFASYYFSCNPNPPGSGCTVGLSPPIGTLVQGCR